jgi:hypothetical protein
MIIALHLFVERQAADHSLPSILTNIARSYGSRDVALELGELVGKDRSLVGRGVMLPS